MAINKLPTPSANYKVVENDTVMRNKINEVVDEVNDHSNKLLDLLARLGLIADYVIETGSSGIWEYKKYNSGIIEIWGQHSTTATFTEVGNWHRTETLTVTLPTGITRIDYISPPGPLGSNAWGGYLQSATLSAIGYRLTRSAGGLTNVPVDTYFKIIGRWK